MSPAGTSVSGPMWRARAPIKAWQKRRTSASERPLGLKSDLRTNREAAPQHHTERKQQDFTNGKREQPIQSPSATSAPQKAHVQLQISSACSSHPRTGNITLPSTAIRTATSLGRSQATRPDIDQSESHETYPPLPPPSGRVVTAFFSTCSVARNLRIERLTVGWSRSLLNKKQQRDSTPQQPRQTYTEKSKGAHRGASQKSNPRQKTAFPQKPIPSPIPPQLNRPRLYQ